MSIAIIISVTTEHRKLSGISEKQDAIFVDIDENSGYDKRVHYCILRLLSGAYASLKFYIWKIKVIFMQRTSENKRQLEVKRWSSSSILFRKLLRMFCIISL